MAYRPNKLGRIAIKIQGSGWGTPETSFASTNYIEAEVGVPVYTREALRIDPLRSGFEEAEVLAGGRGPVELPIRFPLHGWSTATPSANPTEHPDALLIKMALGAAVQTGYTAANMTSGGSTTAVKVTTGNTSWEGSGLLVPVTTAPAYELLTIADVDLTPTPDLITPLVALQRTPATSGAHYGSNTIYLTNDTPSPITMDWIGVDAGAHIRLSDGLVKSLRVVGGARKNPMVEATLRFTGTTTFPGSGGSLAAYSYGFPLIPALVSANGAGVYFNGAWDVAAEVAFGVDVTIADVEGWGSAEGIVQQMVTDRKVSASLTQASDGTMTADLLAPGTAITKLQALYACLTPGRAAGFVFPSPVLIEQASMSDRNGLLAVTYSMAPQVYAGDGGAGSGAGNTAARFIFA